MRQVIDYGGYFRAPNVRPRILARTASKLSGGGAGVMVTRLPAGPAKRRNAGSARPSSGPDEIVVIRDEQGCQ